MQYHNITFPGEAGRNSKDLDMLLYYSSQHASSPRPQLKIDILRLDCSLEGTLGLPFCSSPMDFRAGSDDEDESDAERSFGSDDDTCVDSDFDDLLSEECHCHHQSDTPIWFKSACWALLVFVVCRIV
ncbi:hypothetical protein PMIN03_012919, partial [Paraphaeosphaeria minitans]